VGTGNASSAEALIDGSATVALVATSGVAVGAGALVSVAQPVKAIPVSRAAAVATVAVLIVLISFAWFLLPRYDCSEAVSVRDL
jgi:hypothetical protein